MSKKTLKQIKRLAQGIKHHTSVAPLKDSSLIAFQKAQTINKLCIAALTIKK